MTWWLRCLIPGMQLMSSMSTRTRCAVHSVSRQNHEGAKVCFAEKRMPTADYVPTVAASSFLLSLVRLLVRPKAVKRQNRRQSTDP